MASPPGVEPRLGHRVHRQVQVEPLGEREERPQPGQQDLAGHAVALRQRAGVRHRRRRARRVSARRMGISPRRSAAQSL